MAHYSSIWLDCAHPGCDRGAAVQPRHLPNLTASGDWYCHWHEQGDPR